MQNLDSTIIATALPTMAQAFGIAPVRMNVALTSYLLSLAVFIPASGWMADRFGTRTVFRAAIAVFTIGSVLCGRADSLAFLVAARILQGIGGAMMVPVGRLVMLRTTPRSELVAAMAWLTTPALIGPVLGPPVGGFIVTYFNWRWIFDINVPIGIVGIILVSLFVQEVREPPRGSFDGIGLALCGLSLSGLMFGMETLGRSVVPPLVTAGLLGGGVLGGLGYALHARRHAAPLLDFSLLRLPCFGVAFTAMMLFRTGIGAIPFLLPMMLQVGFGDSAVESGLITFASSAGALVMKPVAQRVLRAFGFRDTLLWNGAAVRRDAGDLRRLPPHLAGRRDLRRAADRRLLPLPAVHRLQHAGLWRRAAGAHEQRHQPVHRRPAACRDDRRVRRRGLAGTGDGDIRPPSRPAGGLQRGLPGDRLPAAAGSTGGPVDATHCRRRPDRPPPASGVKVPSGNGPLVIPPSVSWPADPPSRVMAGRMLFRVMADGSPLPCHGRRSPRVMADGSPLPCHGRRSPRVMAGEGRPPTSSCCRCHAKPWVAGLRRP